MATIAQVKFLTTNKYFKLAWATTNISFEDAKLLCAVVSPYSDGNANYYYRVRTKKEIWFPRMLNTIIELAPKYGVVVEEYKTMLDDFIKAEERKREREQRKMQKHRDEMRAQLIQNIIASGGVLNATEGSRTPFSYTYLDGELERKKGFDMVFLSDRGRKEYFQQAERNLPYIWNKSNVCEYKGIQVYIEDLDEIAYLVFFKKRVICGEENYIGLVVSEIDYHMDSFISALELHYKNCPF